MPLLKCYEVKIMRDGKDYSYLHPQKQKSIRGAKLGTNYTKSEVIRKSLLKYSVTNGDSTVWCFATLILFLNI